MILLDANVPMYAAGQEHPCKRASVELMRHVATGRIDAAVDAETLQEILHRYRAMGRWDKGREVYDMTRRIVWHVLPITVEHMDTTRRMLDGMPGLSARDALHAAVCISTRASAFCSWDADFDSIPGVTRRTPQALIDPG